MLRGVGQAARAKAFVDKLKDAPCTDCKVKYPPYVMHWDHVRGTKRENIADTVRRKWSVASIKKELAKCELVCANCQAERTHVRSVATRASTRLLQMPK